MKRTRVWLSTVGVFLPFAVAGWVAGTLLPLAGRDLWILRGGLWFLGAAAALLVFLMLRSRRDPLAQVAVPEEDELDSSVADAQRRLATSQLAGTARLNKLAVILLVGPSGSTKTSTLVHSGLEPELLAGEVYRGNAVIPTGALNLWYAQDTIFLEAGGRLIEDSSRWSRLIRHLQPHRLAAVLSRGEQAPRVAVVCFSCEEFLKPGSSEAVPAAARKLRSRLAEVSQQLGIRLPVYVLFTKADRIPHFEDYVRNFSAEEAQEVLGATLPALLSLPAGSFAEHESRRLGEAFGTIFHSLALRRLAVLPRESREEVKGGAYEFPREFRKLSDLATQFLVELCKPSQLSVSPFLRGFYFTGVRPVVVSDAAAVQVPVVNPATPHLPLGASAVFNLQQIRQAAQQPAASSPAASAGSRPVPEWVFLKRLFRELILQDRAAMAATGGGIKVNLLRRALLGVAAAFFLVLSLGFTVSYLNNRHLQQRALAAAHGVQALEVDAAGAPSADALRRLEELRAEVELLERYERRRRPWRLGWGLYTGARLEPGLRGLYFDRFERLLWRGTRSGLLATLSGLPAEPNETSEYGAIYDALKAHLVTTSEPQRSTPAFLTPVLMRHWSAARELDPERLELARRQFDFFATELPFGNPYREPPSQAVVAQTRSFLGQFAGVDQFYQILLSEAATAVPPVEFHRLFPGAETVVRNDFVVPGAFTRDGWRFVQTSLGNVDRLFTREEWVLGERQVTAEDRARLVQELRTRYLQDYVRHWQEYLRRGAVANISGLADGARKLERLSHNQSPLLQMLALAAQQTSVDSVRVAPAFQPLHLVMPPDATDRYIVDANSGYMSALTALQIALEQAANAPPNESVPALTQARTSAEQAKIEIRKLAQSFSVEGEARPVGGAVQRLMEEPVTRVEAYIRTAFTTLPVAGVNQKGPELCRPFQALAAKYPFNPQGRAVASPDELTSVLGPGGSALTAFPESLPDLITQQGFRFAARPGVNPRPTAELLAFLNNAAELSRALYDESGSGPRVAFVLRAQTTGEVPEVRVSLDDQTRTFTRTSAASHSFEWHGARARGMRITARTDAGETTVADEPGPWGVFAAFQRAEWRELGNNRYHLRWRIPGQPQLLEAELILPRGGPVFRSGYLGSRLRCTTTLAR